MSSVPESLPSEIAIRRLGLQDYEPVWRAMQGYTDRRDESTRDEIWFTEHPPVFTLGLNASREHLFDTGDIPVVQIGERLEQRDADLNSPLRIELSLLQTLCEGLALDELHLDVGQRSLGLYIAHLHDRRMFQPHEYFRLADKSLPRGSILA